MRSSADEGAKIIEDLAWPSTPRAWWAVAVLLLAYTASFVDRMILSLLIPDIRTAFSISDTQVSLLVGFSFAIFYAILGLPLGRVADRGHRTRLIATGITIWSVFTAICGVARDYWTLFLARIGVGVGEAALSPSAYSLLGDYFPREKLGRAIAVYSVGVPLGSGVALVISGYAIRAIEGMGDVVLPLIGDVEPWRMTFFLVGLPGLLVALLMLTVKEPIRRGTVTEGTIAELLQFVAQRRAVLLPHFLGLSLLTFVVYGYMAWVPTYFARAFSVSPATFAVPYGIATAIAGAIGLILGGTLADRQFRTGTLDAHLRIVRWAALLSCPFLVAMALAPGPEIALWCFTFGFLTVSMHGGVAGAALQMVTPNRLRGQMTALYFLVANLIGLGLGPTAIALTTDYFYGADSAIGYSLATIAAIVLPLSAIVLSRAFAPFRDAIGNRPAAGGTLDSST